MTKNGEKALLAYREGCKPVATEFCKRYKLDCEKIAWPDELAYGAEYVIDGAFIVTFGDMLYALQKGLKPKVVNEWLEQAVKMACSMGVKLRLNAFV